MGKYERAVAIASESYNDATKTRVSGVTRDRVLGHVIAHPSMYESIKGCLV